MPATSRAMKPARATKSETRRRDRTAASFMLAEEVTKVALAFARSRSRNSALTWAATMSLIYSPPPGVGHLIVASAVMPIRTSSSGEVMRTVTGNSVTPCPALRPTIWISLISLCSSRPPGPPPG